HFSLSLPRVFRTRRGSRRLDFFVQNARRTRRAPARFPPRGTIGSEPACLRLTRSVPSTLIPHCVVTGTPDDPLSTSRSINSTQTLERTRSPFCAICFQPGINGYQQEECVRREGRETHEDTARHARDYRDLGYRGRPHRCGHVEGFLLPDAGLG